jgi:hypothetical protein
MAFYRLISLSDDGGAVEARGAEFAADQDALAAASSLLNEHAGVEIWSGARFVGVLPKDRAAATLSYGDSDFFGQGLSELFHDTWQLAEEIDDPRIARRLFEIANELLALRNNRFL